MKKLVSTSTLLAACLLVASTHSLAQAHPAASGTAPALSAQEDFESPQVPAGWQAEGSHLAITSERFKTGEKSLQWQWVAAGASLEFQRPAAFAKIRDGNAGFGLWVHSEKPAAAPMHAELLHGDKVVGTCWFWMNFQGWRPLGARYKDIGCPLQETVDGIRFHAPEGVAAGELFLDDAKWDLDLPNPDAIRSYQMPWGSNPEELRHPEKSVFSDADLTLNRPWLPAHKSAAEITPQERQDMAVVAERFLPSLVRTHKGIQPEVVDALSQRMAEYRIEIKDSRVTGRPVGGGTFLPPTNAVSFADYISLCGDVQKAFAEANQPEQSLALKRMFVILSAHLLDQGLAEGVVLAPRVNYPDKGALLPFLLMRDVLAEAGLARDLSLALAFNWGGQGFAQYLAEKPLASMDALGYWNNELIPCLLMLPDEAERLQHLRTVQRYYNLALTNPKTIGPDGATYHHGGCHFEYSHYNIPRAMGVFGKLADTSFRLNQEAHERLKAYACAFSLTLSGDEQPYNLGVRAGHSVHSAQNCEVSNLAALALMGTPDGKEPLDKEMAAMYLAQTKSLDKEPGKSWLAQGIRPLTRPDAHLTLNGSPLAIHRRGDWLVAIAGISKFWRGLEIYGWTELNNYGRYLRNGSILVVSTGNPPTCAESGWSRDGWDWCHFPGTTCPLRASHDIFDGWSMPGNQSAFAGGTQIDDDGIWGMDFNGQDDVHFKQSAFCFGDRITVLTSDIHSKTAWPMVTTLFQNSLQPADETVRVDGAALGPFPAEKTLVDGKSHWLLDNKGTGYYLPAGKGTLQVACRPQTWLYWTSKYLRDPRNNPFPTIQSYRGFDPKDRLPEKYDQFYLPSTGNFALAWFDHGEAPTNASCAYTLVVRATPERMEAMAKDAPYTLLQQDVHAHALRDNASRTTGYVLFDANEKLAADGLLLANNQPCFVMLRQEAQDGQACRASVACTDIQRTQPVRLTFKGAWNITAPSNQPITVTPDGENTRVEMQPESYMSMALELKAIQ